MWRRLAFVRQDDQSDCGPAALATIALHHRMPIGLQQLRELSGTDRVGTNLHGLVAAAERLGFSPKGLMGTDEALPRIPLPAIAHIKNEEGLGHFVVVHRVRRRSILVADPARGIRVLSREEFRRAWTGALLVVPPGPGIGRGAEASAVAKPEPPGRRFLGLLAIHRGVLAEAFFCALLMTMLGVATSYFVRHLVDSVLDRGEGRLLNALGVGMVLVTAFRALFGVLRQYLVAHVGRQVDLALIARYARHVLGLPMAFFEARRVGEILSRVNDAAKVREAVSGTTLTAVVDGTLVLGLLAVLWAQDLRLAMVATAFVPLLLLAVAAHHPSARRRSLRAMEDASRLSSHLVEDVSGVETVKAFGLQRDRAEQGEQHLVDLARSTFSLQMLGLSMGSLATGVTGLASVAILWYGGHRVIDGALTIGDLMFFYTLLGYLLDPLQRLASVNLQIQDALVAIDRLFQVLDLEPEPIGGRHTIPFRRLRRSIRLRGVGFRYGRRSQVLRDVSLSIPSGKTVAIVGESGSGKSTLLKLLMGFHEPTQGSILIDRVDLRDHDLATLRDRIGLVSQDPFIFNGTIYENIALGRPGARPEEVDRAARAAGLQRFIAGLPERYETIIGERGANLSGGQRQRLAIARALLKRPEIVIFDEATSHLDTATERAIQEGIRTALAGKTVVLVAHRLSTIRDADLIYVMHEGRVAEHGTHQELMAREGRYCALWRAQAEPGGSADRRRAPGRHRIGVGAGRLALVTPSGEFRIQEDSHE